MTETVLSIDIGIKNMGICVTYHDKIVLWYVAQTDGKTRDIINLMESIVSIICEIASLSMSVLVEQQPHYNKKMKRIFIIIETYCLALLPQCSFHAISSNTKWKKLDMIPPKVYYQRKQLSIRVCRGILENEREHAAWSCFFESHSKKDDLSDSFLQLWTFLKRDVSL
uniref:Mitochondrial resolvase Ydc2 catalytic domain-containing protein n=1 Tax=viral metagenome TaxID=1070528 RepID=A0A6C0CQC9_9ZZZZ